MVFMANDARRRSDCGSVTAAPNGWAAVPKVCPRACIVHRSSLPGTASKPGTKFDDRCAVTAIHLTWSKSPADDFVKAAWPVVGLVPGGTTFRPCGPVETTPSSAVNDPSDRRAQVLVRSNPCL